MCSLLGLHFTFLKPQAVYVISVLRFYKIRAFLTPNKVCLLVSPSSLITFFCPCVFPFTQNTWKIHKDMFNILKVTEPSEKWHKNVCSFPSVLSHASFSTETVQIQFIFISKNTDCWCRNDLISRRTELLHSAQHSPSCYSLLVQCL